MSVLKQVVLTMSQKRVEPEISLKPVSASRSASNQDQKRLNYQPVAVSSRPKSPSSQKSVIFQQQNFVEAEMDETNVHKPTPTEFVSFYDFPPFPKKCNYAIL